MTDDKSDCQVKAHPEPTAYDDDISNSTDVQILSLAITLQCNPLFIIIVIIITIIIIIIIMITSLVTRRFELWNIPNSTKFFLFQFNCQRALQGGNYDWIQKLLLNSIFTFFWQNNSLLQKLNSSLQAKPPSCYIVGHSCLILWFLKRISCPKTVGREVTMYWIHNRHGQPSRPAWKLLEGLRAPPIQGVHCRKNQHFHRGR